MMIILLFLSFFLSKTKTSGFCARCFSVVVVVLLFENRNFFRESEKILQQKNKKEERETFPQTHFALKLFTILL
jgi:hypothetical protein